MPIESCTRISSRQSVALEGFNARRETYTDRYPIMEYPLRVSCSSRGVPKKVADHGVAPEGFMPIERRTQKGSRSCEEQVGKGISHLA
jgi:hypothetical protein